MIDQSKGERIAFRSTRGEGRFQKSRWSELAVYYKPGAQAGHVFTAELSGCSVVEGEKRRSTCLSSNSLERALQHFNDSAPARSVRDQAHVWLENNGGKVAVTATAGDAFPPAGTYTGTQRDQAAAALMAMDAGETILFTDACRMVDAVARSLGLQRETARG